MATYLEIGKCLR